MAQSTILAAAKTAATSTDVTVTAGTPVTIGVFSATYGRVPHDALFTVYADTPGADNVWAVLTDEKRAVTIEAPGTYRVKRTVYSTGESFGVYLET